LFEAAVERDADFVFVHHGLSWGLSPRRLTGYVAERYRMLLANGITLYAAHLPLDAAPKFGNNAVLSQLIGLRDMEPFFRYDGVDIGFLGTLPSPRKLGALREFFAERFKVTPQCLGELSRSVSRVAVVSGGGGLDSLEEAAARGADLLLTGELGHTMYHPARESRVAVLALGHYASETTGPRALMEVVAAKFGLEVEFVDIPTGL
ncbi:MAG: Nif3-like dinuclear metal center hexameric protein, partial [Lentisphaeria bacterium]|nr:Nif3-like dinuclear metal center hexameric protein [Lentisphaeria bacterium]